LRKLFFSSRKYSYSWKLFLEEFHLLLGELLLFPQKFHVTPWGTYIVP
jgi:hypothetical protein